MSDCVEVLGCCRHVEVLILLLLFVWFGTGMHEGLVFWMHFVLMSCWFLLGHGRKCHPVAFELHGGLGRCFV